MNADVCNLNSTILTLFPGEACTFNSLDSYTIDSPSVHKYDNVSVKFIHILNTFGLPVAQLQLKIECPIILLRKIDTSYAPCN